MLDPSFRPAATYNFNFSIQREIRPKMLFEVGYIGRIITHEWMQRDLDAVPTMMTLGGQSYRAGLRRQPTLRSASAAATPGPAAVL